MSTRNWVNLQTLGCQPIMPKNLPDHRYFNMGQIISPQDPHNGHDVNGRHARTTREERQ